MYTSKFQHFSRVNLPKFTPQFCRIEEMLLTYRNMQSQVRVLTLKMVGCEGELRAVRSIGWDVKGQW